MGADTHVDAGGVTPPRTQPADPTPTQKPCVFVGIGGMTCGGCAARVQESMAALEGVAAVEVDLSAMRATVFAADENTELAALRGRAEGCIRSLGYEVLPGHTAPVTDAAATGMTPPSSFSSSLCCLPALRRNSLTVSPLPPSAPAADCCVPPPPSGLDSAVEAATAPPPRQRSSALFPVRRFRRGPCGCGGRGCLCAIVPVQEMMTEETRLLGGADDGAAATIPRYDAAVAVEVGTHKKRKAATAAAAAAGGMAAVPPATAIARTTLLIEGMSCTSCAARIEMALQRVAGVESASVNFSTMSGCVLHSTARASLERVVGCVADLGFTVTTQSTTAKFATAEEESCGECCCSTNLRAIPLRAGDIASCYEHRILVKGMSCASCAARIEAAVCQLPQVLSCTVSFATGTAVVNTRTASGYLEVCEVLESMGYTATDMASIEPEASLNRTRDALERTREIAEHERNLIGSALLSLPLAGVMLLMMFTSVMEEHMTLARVLDGVQLCATTPIVFYYGRSFFTNAWRSFQHGAYTMDTLVALGTGCTYVYSVVVYMLALLVFPHAHMMTYFDTAGMLTTFMLLGRFLEAKAKRSTSGALIELMTLVPTTALCVRPDGTEVRVSTAELEKGAMVRVLAGDRVPVDGVIVDGSSELDEQMITGESLPKYKKPGESVVGGTLNITATLLIQADKVGAETMMAQVLRIVQEAQNTKPAVQRVADRIAMYFVPFVLSLSLATLAVWLVLGATHAYPDTWREHGTTWQAFAFNFFISTVVAACPCALGLATPTAVMVGTGVGAKNGVLVKSGSTLEVVRKVDCVVLDKTGTLTKGQLEVVGTDTATAAMLPHGVDAAMARRLVGLVEAQSNHPIAKAVSERLLAERGGGSPCAARPPPQQLQHLRYEVGAVVTHGGKGLEACVTVRKEDDDKASATAVQHRLLVGNVALLQGHGVEPSTGLLEKMRAANGRGLTTVLAAIDGVACVLVSLADEPKREARGVVQHLRKGGVRVLMVTGDNAGVATRIAAEVGIAPADVHAEALPTAKAEIVQELQRSGLRVMFVGDGINDSPALAQANVGVALGAGTEVAIEAADAVLVRNSLVDLLNLRSLSTTTVRRIYGNFVWAFGYNLLMLPVASGLLFPLLHRQLPPVLAGAAMMLSSLSVLTSSLSIRCFRPYRERDFYHD